jgi:hypothetical protein
MSTGTAAFRSAATILWAQEMPPAEIRAVIYATDAETVHRYLELHRERLEERLAEQCRVLNDVERSLAEHWIGGYAGGSSRDVADLMSSRRLRRRRSSIKPWRFRQR